MRTLDHLRILYAEDDEDACLMISILLGFSGIEVLSARTAREALQSAQNAEFDLYLLDSRLPDGCGYELCRKLREITPQTPIVFYSGAGYETDKQKGFSAGADKYLVKPNSDLIADAVFQLVSAPPAQY